MMQAEKITDILPHRYPFLFVDRVLDVDTEQNEITCLKNVSHNESFFHGHFPGNPVMPGVLIIEAMAQASGILGHHVRKAGSNVLYYFASADKVRFRKPVVPGDQLILKAKLISLKFDIWKFHCEALVDGQVVVSAEVACARKEMVS